MTHLREPKLAWSYLSLSPKTQGVEDTVLQGARATPSRDDSPGSRHYGALAQAINRGSEVQEEEKPQGHNMAGGRVRRDVHCQTQPYRGVCARTRRGHFIQGYRSPSCTLPNGDVDTASRARNWTDARTPTLPESCEGLYMCYQHVNALH